MLKRFIFVLLAGVLIFLGFNFLRKEIQERDMSYQTQLSLHKKSFTSQLDEKDKKITDLEKSLAELNEQSQLKNKKYHFLAVGDIMMDRGVERVIKKLSKDYHFSFEYMKPVFEKADFVFANLEGSLSDVGRDMGSKYSFHFELGVADALRDAGINIVSLANNHMLDWGRASVCATTKNLKAAHIDFVGAGCNQEQAERESIVEFGNTRIALVAYSELNHWAKAGETTPGMSEWNFPNMKKKIAKLKEQANIDLVFVSVHWGDEYKNRAPERIVKYGHALVDAGADVIIGHHPHVDQEIERYGKGWIIYSLGNFIFDQSWSKNTMEGLMADIIIQDKKVLDIAPSFIDINKHYQPRLRNTQ